MIYQPQVVFNVKANILAAFISAIARFAIDLIRQQNQPWEYYLGYGFGGAALGTGIVGAQATLYAVGAGTVKLFFETSPGAANARLFLDGVAQGDLDLSDEVIDTIEYIFNVPDDGNLHSLSVLNLGTLAHATPTDWLMLLAVELAGDTILEPTRSVEMAYDTIVFRLQDAEGDPKKQPFIVRVPSGFTLAQLQTYVDGVAPEVDAVTESVIDEVTVLLALTLPGGLKTEPIAGAFNERGGLISFDTAGPRADSVRIPAIRKTIMPGNAFSLADTAIAALITRLTTQTTAANIRPVDQNDYNYETAVAGKKSLRRK